MLVGHIVARAADIREIAWDHLNPNFPVAFQRGALALRAIAVQCVGAAPRRKSLFSSAEYAIQQRRFVRPLDASQSTKRDRSYDYTRLPVNVRFRFTNHKH